MNIFFLWSGGRGSLTGKTASGQLCNTLSHSKTINSFILKFSVKVMELLLWLLLYSSSLPCQMSLSCLQIIPPSHSGYQETRICTLRSWAQSTAPLKSLASEGYTWFRWGPWWLARTCCSHTCCPPPPWRDYCWGSAGSQRTCQSQHRNRKKRWGKKKGEGAREDWELDWQVDKTHGYDVNFHVSEDLCYECSHSPLTEGRCTEETLLDACQEDDLSHRQLSINIQRHRQTHTNRHIY